jgi:hypothetical protein
MPDEFLLFSDLPFDFEAGLPLDLACGVFIDSPRPAYNAVDADEDLAVLATPYRHVGMGEVHVCFRRRHTRKIDSEKARDDLWLALLALRLVHPIHIRTTACFAVEDNRLVGHGLAESALETRINFSAAGPISEQIVAKVRKVNLRIRTLRGGGLERTRSALILFDHVTTGRAISWQLSVLGLFSCLECLFPQPDPKLTRRLAIAGETHGVRLARRVEAFLQPVRRPTRLRSWLSDAYKTTRNPLAHGFHEATFGGKRTTSVIRIRLLQRLHEVARVTLLGFLGFTDIELRTLLPADAGQIATQNAIDRVGGAPREFLREQRLWT